MEVERATEARTTSPVHRLASALTALLEPGDPSAVVYGTIAVGLVLAAEDPAHETYPRVFAAAAVTVVLYWFAHAFAEVLGERYATRTPPSLHTFGSALRRELGIAEGALPQLAVLAIGWIVGAALTTDVAAALWTTVAVLVVFELVSGVRAKLSSLRLVGGALFGAALGVTLLGIKAVLH